MPTIKDSLRALASKRNRLELEHEAVPDQKLWIQELSGAERDAWEDSVAQKQGKDGLIQLSGLRARLIQMSLVDESGTKIYAESEMEDINQLPSRFREDLFDAALEFNGLTRQAEEAELKNSNGEAGNGSSPASRQSSENPTFGVYLHD